MKRNPATPAASELPGCIVSVEPGVWRLNIWVQPGANRNEPAGLYQDCCKIKLSAPPVDNKANKALVIYIAGLLGLRKSQVSLESGLTSRRKSLLIHSATEPEWSAVMIEQR